VVNHQPTTGNGSKSPRRINRKCRYLKIVLAGVAFLLALILTLYPVVSNAYNQEHQSVIQTAYEEVLADTDGTELEHIRELAEAYNRSLVPGTAGESYSQAALLAASEDYDSQLDPGGSGIMAYVEIPKIGVELPIYHGSDDETLERGTGHLLGSSLPVGGENTHSVITGHSGMATQKMFTDLEQLEPGDVFYLRVLDTVLAYQVREINTVLPHETSLLGITSGEDLCTLVTCTPTGVNTHRLLVTGSRIPYEEAQEVQEVVTRQEETASRWEGQYLTGLFIGILAVLALLLIALTIRQIYQRIQKPKRRKAGKYVKK